MSALEPTSTPRVGSSTIRMRGSRASHLASSTFCWLPPDRLRTCAGRSAWRCAGLDVALGDLRASPGVESSAVVGIGLEIRGDDVGDDAEIDEEPAVLAVLGQHRDARRHGIRGASGDRAWPSTNGARRDRPHPEDRLADFGATGAEQSGEADDLAIAERERGGDDPAADSCATSRATLHPLARDGGRARRRAPADHHRDQSLVGRVAAVSHRR